MADIFISYKKEDAGRVVRLVEALRAEGFTVWWDHGIAPGAQWDKTIQTELAAAKAVIAIWSKQSVDAPWVKEEAAIGKSRGVLLPIRIDEVDPPLGFSLIQMGDLIGWNGDAKDPHFTRVLEALRAILRGETPQGLEVVKRRRQTPVWAWAMAAVAALVIGAGAIGYLALRDGMQVTHARKLPATPGDPTESSVTVTRGAPPPEHVAPVQTAPAPTARPSAPSDADIEAWDQANREKSRASFRAYLAAFPSGFYADQARAFVASCRIERSERWDLKQEESVHPGDNATPMANQNEACRAAREASTLLGQRHCDGFKTSDQQRRGFGVVSSFDPCTCTQSPAGWSCRAEGEFFCQYEERAVTETERCG